MSCVQPNPRAECGGRSPVRWSCDLVAKVFGSMVKSRVFWGMGDLTPFNRESL